MYRPLTAEDFAFIPTRLASASEFADCWVPVREDCQTTAGHRIPGMLSWGHPACYKFVTHEKRVYAVREWDMDKPELFGPPL